MNFQHYKKDKFIITFSQIMNSMTAIVLQCSLSLNEKGISVLLCIHYHGVFILSDEYHAVYLLIYIQKVSLYQHDVFLNLKIGLNDILRRFVPICNTVQSN